MDTNQNRQQFIDIYKQHITREGSDRLLEWLLNTDFFSAPASTRFHNAFDGGLCDHSIKVYKRLLMLWENEKKLHPEMATYTHENIAICGLLHDLCKVNLYSVEFRNAKIDGVWEQVPFYSVKDNLPYGHGEKSVYIISGFIRLTRDEAMAINWHMGGFDSRVKGGDFSLSKAFQMFPLATLTHSADFLASYFDEIVD